MMVLINHLENVFCTYLGLCLYSELTAKIMNIPKCILVFYMIMASF